MWTQELDCLALNNQQFKPELKLKKVLVIRGFLLFPDTNLQITKQD
jgi:hypothetical protein